MRKAMGVEGWQLPFNVHWRGRSVRAWIPKKARAAGGERHGPFREPAESCTRLNSRGVHVIFLRTTAGEKRRVESEDEGMRGCRGLKAALVLYVVMALVFSACGKESSEGLLKRELPENATPEKIMLEGLNATDEVRTLHYVFEYSFLVPPTGEQPYPAEVKLSGEGDYDAATENAMAHIIWPTFEREFDYVLFQGVQYYRLADSDTWYELPSGSTLRIPSVSQITRNTAEYLDNFQRITRLQDEVVDGRDCYHIAMVPNFDAIMENQEFLNMIKGGKEELDETTLSELEKIKQGLKGASVNYEYWFDKEFLVLRRTLYHIEMTSKGDEDTQSFTVKVIMDIKFPIYNREVDIAKPEPTTLYRRSS